VPDATQKKRTWAACVCPLCRFVFRVPKKHDGKGVVCPACNYLLRIPEHELTQQEPQEVSREAIATAPRGKQETKPIVARSMDDVEPLPSEESESQARHKRKTSSGRARVSGVKRSALQLPEWEQEESKSRASSKDEGSSLPWILGGSLLGLSVVAVGAWLVAGAMDRAPSIEQDETSQWVPDDSNLVLDPPKVELTAEELEAKKEINDSIETGVSVLTDSSVTVKKFLAVKNPEDFQKLVRFPDISMPRIREWYKAQDPKSLEVREVGYGGRVTVKGRMASLTLQMQDYTLKQIALERTDEGYRVDWESWVGWTEMKWDSLFSKRPTEPKQVLVRASLDNYYNRDFNDDTKWTAVKITNPQSERTLYGYLDRDDPALMRFARDLGKGELASSLRNTEALLR